MLSAAVALFVAAAPAASWEVRERHRVQQHLIGAEALLALGAPPGLSASQRERRSAHLERLRAYRAAGVFPKNRNHPGRFVPYFVDADGVHCAVAHLIAESGEAALVERIAASRNNATVHELADEPGLSEWLTANGLTLDEAARIQPGYWSPEVQVEGAPSTAVVGACMGPVIVRVPELDGGASHGNSYVWSHGPIGFFADDGCATSLSDGRGLNKLELAGGAATFFLSPREEGTMTYTVAVGSTEVERQLTVTASGADAGVDGAVQAGRGCAAVPASSVIALCGLGALFLRRRTR